MPSLFEVASDLISTECNPTEVHSEVSEYIKDLIVFGDLTNIETATGRKSKDLEQMRSTLGDDQFIKYVAKIVIYQVQRQLDAKWKTLAEDLCTNLWASPARRWNAAIATAMSEQFNRELTRQKARYVDEFEWQNKFAKEHKALELSIVELNFARRLMTATQAAPEYLEHCMQVLGGSVTNLDLIHHGFTEEFMLYAAYQNTVQNLNALVARMDQDDIEASE